MSQAEEVLDDGVDESGGERALVVVTSGSDVFHSPAESGEETAAEPACRAEAQATRRDGRGGWRLVDVDSVGWREPCDHGGCFGEIDHDSTSGHRMAALEADQDDLEALEDVEVDGSRWFP